MMKMAVREWLQQQYDYHRVSVPRNPNTRASRPGTAHPDICQWIQQRLEEDKEPHKNEKGRRAMTGRRVNELAQEIMSRGTDKLFTGEEPEIQSGSQWIAVANEIQNQLEAGCERVRASMKVGG